MPIIGTTVHRIKLRVGNPGLQSPITRAHCVSARKSAPKAGSVETGVMASKSNPSPVPKDAPTSQRTLRRPNGCAHRRIQQSDNLTYRRRCLYHWHRRNPRPPNIHLAITASRHGAISIAVSAFTAIVAGFIIVYDITTHTHCPRNLGTVHSTDRTGSNAIIAGFGDGITIITRLPCCGIHHPIATGGGTAVCVAIKTFTRIIASSPALTLHTPTADSGCTPHCASHSVIIAGFGCINDTVTA